MFLKASLDWFLGKRGSHMGLEQYAAHAGMRVGQPTSGDLLWAAAEAERAAAAGNMVNAETGMLQNKVANEIGFYVPEGTTLIELGPGTITAFRNKTLPLIRKLAIKNCVLVDESKAFLKQIMKAKDISQGLKIETIVADFFENDIAYCGKPAVICSFGSTISNIINPISTDLPEKALVDGLVRLASAAKKGWLLIGFDSDQNGERIISYFKKYSLFQLNIFDRMAVELPIKGDFDPTAFGYEPEWIAESGQLAHIAVVKRNMNFTLDGKNISLKKGQKLHIKNSYKFTTEFFEKCCKLTGLEVVKNWSDDSPAKVYLLKVPPKQPALNQRPVILRRA